MTLMVIFWKLSSYLKTIGHEYEEMLYCCKQRGL